MDSHSKIPTEESSPRKYHFSQSQADTETLHKSIDALDIQFPVIAILESSEKVICDTYVQLCFDWIC